MSEESEKVKVSGSHSRRKMRPGLRFAVLKRDGYRCHICGRSAQNTPGLVLEVDHRFPHSKGGMDTQENLWTLCFDCNRGKSATLLVEDEQLNSSSKSPATTTTAVGSIPDPVDQVEAARQRRAKKAQAKEPHPNLFRMMREARGLTREEFARLSKLKLKVVVALETDKPSPIRQKYWTVRMAEALNVSYEEIIEALSAWNTKVTPVIKAQQEK